jgi:hypothetical protein
MQRKIIIVLTRFNAKRSDRAIELIRIDRIIIDPQIGQIHAGKIRIVLGIGRNSHCVNSSTLSGSGAALPLDDSLFEK